MTRGRRPAPVALLVVLLLATASLTGGTLVVAPSASAQPTPVEEQTEVIANPPFAEPGTKIIVRGKGWPAGAAVQVALCGNGAFNGISDCDTTNSNTTNARTDGTFATELVVGTPPKPCDCVINVTSPDTNLVVNQPFEIIGAVKQPPSQEIIRRKAEISASLSGSGPLLAFFGGSAERELDVTVRNTGTVPLTEPPVVVTLGQGDDPTDVVAEIDVGTIAPGDEVTKSVTVTIPGPTLGTYTIKTSIDGIDEPLSVRSTTTSYPWALLVVAWLLIQIPLLGLYRRRTLGPDDPLEREFEHLLLPPPDYGVGSVRDFVEPYAVHVAEDDPPTTVVVSGQNGNGNGNGSKRRRSGASV